MRPLAKPNNHVSGSKQLQYTAVNYELHAVSETIELQCPKDEYTLMKLGGIPFNILNIMSANFGYSIKYTLPKPLNNNTRNIGCVSDP